MEKADVERPRPLVSVSGPWHFGVVQMSDGQSWGLTGVRWGDEEWPPSDGMVWRRAAVAFTEFYPRAFPAVSVV